MYVLLTVVGAALAFAVGWAFGHSGRPIDSDLAAPEPETVSSDGFELVEDHPTGMIVSNAAGSVSYRNAAARRLHGTHVGVLVDAAIDRHLDVGRLGQRSEELVEFYGPPRQVFVVRAMPLEGGRAVAYVDDISERRRVEQIRTDFVANISHELKTPVGAMSVLAETLVDEDDPSTIARVVDRIMSEANRASRTIDDLIELSRIELGGERAVEPVRVTDLVRAATDRVTELASQQRVTVSALEVLGSGDDGNVVMVEGDRRQLESAVGNLVENAVKYSEPGGLVQIRVRRAEDAAEIVVADDGVGIPQRDLDRIFERFYRVDRARSRKTGGTGLGLSIVHHVATNHQGSVEVTSTEGEGSTFVLRIPVEGQQAMNSPQRAGQPPAASEGVA